jgi:hypothetical protein
MFIRGWRVSKSTPIETRELTMVELARRIAFVLGTAAREQVANGDDDPLRLLAPGKTAEPS